MEVRPEDSAVDLFCRVKHMVMVIPVDAEVHEAQNISQEDWEERLQRVQRRALRNLEFENHDRDQDRHHAITECLETSASHRRYLYQILNARLCGAKIRADYPGVLT